MKTFQRIGKFNQSLDLTIVFMVAIMQRPMNTFFKKYKQRFVTFIFSIRGRYKPSFEVNLPQITLVVEWKYFKLLTLIEIFNEKKEILKKGDCIIYMYAPNGSKEIGVDRDYRNGIHQFITGWDEGIEFHVHKNGSISKCKTVERFAILGTIIDDPKEIQMHIKKNQRQVVPSSVNVELTFDLNEEEVEKHHIQAHLYHLMQSQKIE